MSLWKKILVIGSCKCPSNFKYSEENIGKIRNFETKAKLGNKAVIEFRDSTWGPKKAVEELEVIGVAFCSVDAPELPRKFATINEPCIYGSMVPLNGITTYTLKNSR